jgi:hypothetical protein
LSAGDYREGSLRDQQGSLLRILLEPGRLESGRLESENAPPEFLAADLVEVTGSQALFLGEVQGREGELLIVNVEHSVDRAALDDIQQVWYRPGSE